MCLPRGALLIGGQPFCIGAAGHGGMFSPEAPIGLRFLIRSRLYSAEEARLLPAGHGPTDCVGPHCVTNRSRIRFDKFFS